MNQDKIGRFIAEMRKQHNMTQREFADAIRIENRMDTIESCYTDTYNHYKYNADKMEGAYTDI